MTIQMKAIEQYFHVVLFFMLYKVVLILSVIKSVDEMWYRLFAVYLSSHFQVWDKLPVLITNLPTDSCSFEYSSVSELRLDFVLVKLTSNHLFIRSNAPVMTKYNQ